MAMPPFFVISEATNPILRMLISRCSRENPGSDDRCLRTVSPSSRVTGGPLLVSAVHRIACLEGNYATPPEPGEFRPEF